MPHSPLSRRSFLQSSAAAAVPLMLGRRAGALPSNDPDAIKVGLVGCGGRGTGAAHQALQAENGTVVLTAVADLFQDRMDSSLKALQDALGENADRLQVDEDHRFLGFDAFEKLLATDVDVVLLATPPHFRPQHLAAAIAAGKHVFAEKPFAVDAPGVRSVLETAALAKSKNLALVSGFCWRYNERHRALFERVHDGAIGDLRAVYTTYNTTPNGERPRQEGWSDMEWQIRNWFNFLWLSGDHITEQACHSLDKMAWAMQDVAPLSVTRGRWPPGAPGPRERQHLRPLLGDVRVPGRRQGLPHVAPDERLHLRQLRLRARQQGQRDDPRLDAAAQDRRREPVGVRGRGQPQRPDVPARARRDDRLDPRGESPRTTGSGPRTRRCWRS